MNLFLYSRIRCIDPDRIMVIATTIITVETITTPPRPPCPLREEGQGKNHSSRGELHGCWGNLIIDALSYQKKRHKNYYRLNSFILDGSWQSCSSRSGYYGGVKGVLYPILMGIYFFLSFVVVQSGYFDQVDDVCGLYFKLHQ